MQVISGSLVAVMEANDKERGLFPGMTPQAEILFTETDGGDIADFWIDSVDFRNLYSGSSEIMFALKGEAARSWKISVTKRRITVWNAASWGLLGPAGKGKVKAGKASAGHLKYESIAKISAFTEGGNAILMLISGKEKPKILRGLTLKGTLDDMKGLLKALYQSLDNWLIENGCKEIDEASNPAVQKRLLDWGEFPNKAWAAGTGEVSVQVPNKAIVILP